MDLSKIPNSMPIEFFNTKVLKALTTEDWSALAFQREWTSEQLGKEIVKEKINVYNDDTLLDLYLRVQSKEQKLIIKSLKMVSKNKDLNSYKNLTNGNNYHKSVPPDVEKDLFVYFEKYKNNFGE